MQKPNPHSGLTPEELAAQLRQPTGAMGKEVAHFMNEGNRFMCLTSYQKLNPDAGNMILEIGMGNGFFVKELLAMAPELSYTGVDFSEDMVREALSINHEFVQQGSATFVEASIAALPFTDASFNSITTTNTLYFWPNPVENANELFRVLKPGGKLLLAYRPSSFLDRVPFTKFGFTKWDIPEVEKLLADAGFKNIKSYPIQEPDVIANGNTYTMESVYTLVYKG